MSKFVLWVADVGSIKRDRFGWCRASSVNDKDIQIGTDITEFAHGIAGDLNNDRKVALGFECPLFIPVTTDPISLTSARQGEGNRPWSAGAGTAALVVGLTEAVWIFEKIREQTESSITPTFDWLTFTSDKANLFIWEAFVSGKSKEKTHAQDAVRAAKQFWRVYPDIPGANSVNADDPFSLVGAALIRAGLTSDLSTLSESCNVIKVYRS